jgi:hypothetical protein
MGTVKYNAQVSLSASTYNTALAFPSVLDVPPASDTATGISRIHTKGVNRLVVKFAGTDAANETFGYQIIGLSETVYDTQGSAYFVPIRIGSGVATLGAKTYGATGASLGTAATLWVDTITDTATKSPYMTVFSPANDEVAEIVVDCGPFDYIYIQGSRDSATAATFSIITQIYDSCAASTNIEDITLTGTGLSTAALQTTGNTSLASSLASISIADTNYQGRQAILGTASPLASDTAYKRWLIWPDTSSANTSYRFTAAGTAATTSYPTIDDGGWIDLCFDTAVKCSMIGASASGNVNVIAW